MEAEDHSAQLLQEVFADKSVYEILEVDTKATPEQIKKAYRKLALRYHPDKGGDVKKFQALSIAHAVLSDPEKRRIYDQTGDVDGEDSKDFDDWFAYFRNLFPAITVANIDSFGDRYMGSAEEKKDIVETYGRFKGDLKKMLECIMCAEEEDAPRICGIVDACIAEGLLTTTKKYTASRVDPESKPKAKKGKAGGKRKSSEEALVEIMRARDTVASAAASAFGSIFAKYGGDEGGEYEIGDEEFEKLRDKVAKKGKKRK
ncbi:DnaJ domain-containing protein [Ochromonadaceae sp. CCMP2298]|nr:DnaJ domain-containing protein [Ochromonadaceae sp. CCMP2298]